MKPASSYVLDASALLALIQGEPGAERAQAALSRAALSSVNLSEVVTKLIAKGVSRADIDEIIQGIEPLVRVHDLGLAVAAGLLHHVTRGFGLSLGDRSCLALAQALGAVALTTDRAWADLRIGIEVEVIR